MTSWKREAPGVALAVTTFVVVLLVSISLLTVGQDIPPSGAVCVVETATTSAAVGVEEVRWAPLPHRTCVVGDEALGASGHPGSGPS